MSCTCLKRLIQHAGLFDNVLSDYLWARAVLLIGESALLRLPNSMSAVECLRQQSMRLTGPTLATVGLSVQVPLAVAADGTLGNPPWLHSIASALLMVCGAVEVLVGFLGVTLSTGQVQSSTLQSHTSEEELTDQPSPEG